MPDAPPARITFIPSASAPLAVILRRRRAKLFHVSIWNTHSDHVRHGTWFTGQIREGQCSLSPDGQWFVYFAIGSRGQMWTGISRPPLLRAEVYLPESSTWGGGGHWLNSKYVQLNTPFNDDELVWGEPGRPRPRSWPFTITDAQRIASARDDARSRHERFEPPDMIQPARPHIETWERVYERPGTDRGSAALTADGELLIARNGVIERWSESDARRGNPGFQLDLEPVLPCWWPQTPPGDDASC